MYIISVSKLESPDIAVRYTVDINDVAKSPENAYQRLVEYAIKNLEERHASR